MMQEASSAPINIKGKGGSNVETSELKKCSSVIIQISGTCIGCGNADYHEVCDRGKPEYGPDGLYCGPCHQEANTSPFGEDRFDR